MENCTCIKIKAVDQRLTIVQQPLLASGDIGTVRVEYDLDSSWDGYAPSGAFYTHKNQKDVYEQVLVHGACGVPWEVLQEEGLLYIGLRGVDGTGRVKTAAPIRYRIEKGSPCGTDTPAEPTPDVYQQILSKSGNAEAIAKKAETTAQKAETTAQKAETLAQSVRDDADSGVLKGEKGDPGKNAYDFAKEGGYTGTEQQFAQDVSPYGLREDFERSAAYIKQYPNDLGEYTLEMGKTYLVKRIAESLQLGRWETELVGASISGGGSTGPIMYGGVSDPYNPYYKVRLHAVKWEMNTESSGFSGEVYYQIDGYHLEAKGVQAGDFSNGGDYMFDDIVAKIIVTDATEVLLVNDHAEIRAKDAYEIAIEEGFTGTRKEWIESIQTKIDESLTMKGGAADSKIVGDKFRNIENIIADILYEPISITSFAVSPSTAEKGSTVSKIDFTWKLNKKAVSVTLDDEPCSVDQNSLTSDGEFGRTHTFTLKATDERNHTATKTATLSFLNGVYYGASAIPETLDSAFVLTLTKTLRSNKLPSFTANAGEGQYIYYCLPKSYGTCTFAVGGFSGGFKLVDTISFTNASGYTEDEGYYVYRSDNANLGNTAVTVG